MPTELASQRQLEASIRSVLEASDEVKFAGRPVAVDQLRLWASDATSVVRQTIPSADNDEEDAAAKGGGDGAVVNCLKMTWAPLRLSQAYHATLVVKNALTAFRKKPGQGRSKL